MLRENWNVAVLTGLCLAEGEGWVEWIAEEKDVVRKVERRLLGETA